MSYASLQDLKDRFAEEDIIQLTDETNVPPAAIDETTVARALDDAGALIDGYVGKRYTLPLATVPHQLIRAACDIAWYYLHGERASETVKKNHDAAVQLLRDISAAKVNLEVAGETVAATPVGSPVFKEPTRVFTDETLKDY